MSTLKEKQAEATKEVLIRVSRRLFGSRGFAGVSAEEIVASAKLTRGALYHHFDGKEGLFEAVLVETMAEVRDRIARAARDAKTPLEALRLGVGGFLRACAEPELQRILLVDGPAILGWEKWRSLDFQHGIGLLRDGLRRGAAAGQLKVPDVEVASHLIAGALIDGAMVIAQAGGKPATRRAVERNLLAMLAGFR